MNFKALQDRVSVLVQDPSSDITSRISDAINEAYVLVCEQVTIGALKKYFSVTTVVNQPWLNLPSTASGRILFVGTSTVHPTIYDNLEQMLDVYRNEFNAIGDVEAVALEGNILWYQKIPSVATALPLIMYTTPELLFLDSDIPSILPNYCHELCLAYGAAWILMEQIEQGIDGKKVNTMSMKSMFDHGVDRLREWSALNTNHSMAITYKLK